MNEAPACPGCVAAQIRIADLEARIQALEALLGKNASNSSIPPSANPPSAPAPVAKKPSGRKRGGQKGHKGHSRTRLPPEALSHVIALIPSHCQACKLPLPQQPLPGDPDPTWHQVFELPRQPAVVTEFQGHARTCPCGHITHHAIPAEILKDSIGPRLAAALAVLAGCHHVSQRGLEDIASVLLGVPLSLGSLARLQGQITDALQAPVAQLQKEVRAAAVKHVDETGWKNAGQKRWLWVAVTATAVLLLVCRTRGRAALHALLGDEPSGILVSDRWSAYSGIPPPRRQLCWAHLKRDFQAMAEVPGKAGRVGRNLLELVARTFWLLAEVREGRQTRAWLWERLLKGVRPEMKLFLEEGAACGHAATEGTCAHILKLEEALWTFARVDGVEPTNNAAERSLRPAVVRRKKSFGSASEQGETWLGRLFSVVQTLKRRALDVLGYLTEALSCFRHGLQVPLIPAAR